MTTFLRPPPTYNGTFIGPRIRDTDFSVTCAATTTSGCNPALPAGGATIYNFCGWLSVTASFTLPNTVPVNQPDSRRASTATEHLNVSTAPCTPQLVTRTTAFMMTANTSARPNPSPQSAARLYSASSWAPPLSLYYENRIRVSDIPAYFADKEVRNIRRHQQQDLIREKRRDELVMIEANHVRREKELMDAFNQGLANRALREDKIKLALEKASNEIKLQRHTLKLRELDRQTQLTTIVDDSKDVQNQRVAQRFKTALALKAAKREEELKASGIQIKVIETNNIEDGNVVGKREEILREWYAKTDADAQKLLQEVGGDLQQIKQPFASYGTNASSSSRNVAKIA
ncbi:hypothetical protein HDU81_000796 [Chytriomyces hyalinus]|nr:hypothetical protein HDU81_000796 [Chytriomyces hyalinus]